MCQYVVYFKILYHLFEYFTFFYMLNMAKFEMETEQINLDFWSLRCPGKCGGTEARVESDDELMGPELYYRLYI